MIVGVQASTRYTLDTDANGQREILPTSGDHTVVVWKVGVRGKQHRVSYTVDGVTAPICWIENGGSGTAPPVHDRITGASAVRGGEFTRWGTHWVRRRQSLSGDIEYVLISFSINTLINDEFTVPDVVTNNNPQNWSGQWWKMETRTCTVEYSSTNRLATCAQAVAYVEANYETTNRPRGWSGALAARAHWNYDIGPRGHLYTL